MMVRILTTVKHGATSYAPGAEIYMRDADAFQLIQSGGAEPATRGAKKRFSELLRLDVQQRAAAEAALAAVPKETPMFTVFTPGASFLGFGRAAAAALKGASRD